MHTWVNRQMSLGTDPRPPLPNWITDIYTVLSAHITDSDTRENPSQSLTISRDQAVDVLCRSDKALEPADAEYAINRLIERGYLYQVDTELRITIPDAER